MDLATLVREDLPQDHQIIAVVRDPAESSTSSTHRCRLPRCRRCPPRLRLPTPRSSGQRGRVWIHPSADNTVIVDGSGRLVGFQMDWQTPVNIPDSLRYGDGLYIFERFSRAGAVTSAGEKRTFTSTLRALHRPWFAVWMPTGVAELTTTGRKSGKLRKTFVRAYLDGHRAYLVSITGERALWLKNIRANRKVTLRFRRTTLRGIARDPSNATERRAVGDAFCGNTHPFDYAENMFHRKGLPTRTKIIELHAAWLTGGVAIIVDARSEVAPSS